MTHQNLSLWNVFETVLSPGEGGTPLQGLNAGVRPARVCFSGFLS